MINPIKVGAWYFGKSNIFWGLSLFACLAALYVIDLNSPEMAVAAQSSTEITRGTFAKTSLSKFMKATLKKNRH